MREKLKPYLGERKKFIGRFELVSSERTFKGKKQVSILGVVFEDTKEFICDHVWVDLNYNFNDIQMDNLIKFEAKVYNYIKKDMVLEYGLTDVSDIEYALPEIECKKCPYTIKGKYKVICRLADKEISKKKEMMEWCPNIKGQVNLCEGCDNLDEKNDTLYCKEAKNFIGKPDAKIIAPTWCPGRRDKMIEQLIKNETVVSVDLITGDKLYGVVLEDFDTYNYLFADAIGSSGKKYIHKANVVSINIPGKEAQEGA